MEQLHAIGGMPRSGSTLLCNILNQNPAFHASSTSHIPGAFAALTNLHAKSLEVRSEMIHDKEGTHRRLAAALWGCAEGWYRNDGVDNRVIFDKSRQWNHHLSLLHAVAPMSKAIFMVRDLRAIVHSIEKQYAATPLFDDTENMKGKTLVARLHSLFAEDGLVGRCILGIDDILLRGLDCTFIKYEDLVSSPEKTMRSIYEAIKVGPFSHDFSNVKNTARDVDALYLYKFPHDGSGEVRAPEPGKKEAWEEAFPPEIQQQIMNTAQVYNKAFRYS